jgi:hypothetical protein
MSARGEKYLLDANAFIQAKRRFYGLDFCPGYWGALIWHHQQGRLGSIDKVRDEISRGTDDLAEWVEQRLPDAAFANTSTAEIAAVYSQLLAWVDAQPHFQPAAIAEFQQVADGWLVACAKTTGAVVVTLEEFKPHQQNRVPMVNVARAFDVATITPFEMLRRLGVKLSWHPPS